MTMPLRFRLLTGSYSVSRLPAGAPWPVWLPPDGLVSVTRTTRELSVVCDSAAVPSGVQREDGWRALELAGPIPLETTGVAAAFTAPLGRDGISVFVISTYDTDYVLVKEQNLDRAIDSLRASGFVVDR